MAQKLVRCVEGHVYDANAQDACPSCATKSAGSALPAPPSPDNGTSSPADAGPAASLASASPPARRFSPLVIGAAAAAALGAVVLGIVLLRHADRTSSSTTSEKGRSSASIDATTRVSPSDDKGAKVPPAKPSDADPKQDDASRQATGPGREPAPAPRPGTMATDCDRAAMAPFDLDRVTGVEGIANLRDIDPVAAVRICEAATQSIPGERRLWTNLGRAYRAARNDVAAASAYRRGAELGSMFSSYALGLMMRDGAGMTRDPIEARRNLKRAADAGVLPAIVDYARMAENGVGGAQDVAEAQRLYEQAASRNYPPGLNAYGLLLISDRVNPQDPVKAREMFDRAAARGDSEALVNIASMYERGVGGKKDVAAARESYMQAAKLGNTRAMRQLAALTMSSDPAEAERWLKTAAESGDSAALVQTGRAYASGRFGGAPDPITARRYYERAADLGNAEAVNLVGVMYHNGTGVPRDYNLARQYYEKAAALGNSMALTNLGLLYEYGNGVPQDYRQAWRMFETAAAQGNELAMFQLGQMAEAGRGINRDISLARTWYLKSGQAGYADGYWRAVYLIDHNFANNDMNNLAVLALQSAILGSQDALSTMMQSPDRMSRGLRTAIEQFVLNDGGWSGPVTGRFDRSFRDALAAWIRLKQT